nr:vitellogenin 6a [Palaemon carinicauda]
MIYQRVLLLLGFLAVASTAKTPIHYYPSPWPASVPRCSTECPIAGSPKLAYATGKTYFYSYNGKSRIHLGDAEGANSETEWSSQVEVAWLSPCDMAISIRNPSFGGSSGSPKSQVLERYPLIVAIVDGRVQQACNHPEDDVWSINLKKGIASAFQNSLPSNSSINTGLNFTETDIIGNCSTRYNVNNEGEKVIVEKIKNHRFCQDYYVNKAESPKIWPKSPIPIKESVSECKQAIDKGIYSSITCRERKIIHPAYGSYKYIEASQESVLRFQSESENLPQALTMLQGRLIPKTLRYDQTTLKKDSSMEAELDEALKEVCQKIKNGVQADAAKVVAKALHYLRQVPEEEIQKSLEKIRAGQICEEKQKLEGLFLDALAFINESGAVKVMVQELVSGRAKDGRAALYAGALYLMPRPCIHSIQALKPLFENFQHFPRTTVAAASMVNTYCKQNTRCHEKAQVKDLLQVLSNKVNQLCSQPAQEEERENALVLLKAIGNIGVVTPEMTSPLIQCIEKEDADRSIRWTATQAFRNVECTPEFTQAKKKLIDIAVNPAIDTEARIGSYLSSIMCADYEDIRKITDELWRERNTQVRGFILTHLLNIQESTAPYKQDLKYLLTNIVLPSNFTSDIRKYSKNVDVSYYAPAFGVGAGVESNVLYAPGSFLPRSVSMNLTAALGETPFNLGEIGARFDGLEPLLEELFGPEGYIRKTQTGKIFEDISSSISDKFSKIKESLEKIFRQRRSIDTSTLSQLFNKLYGDKNFRLPKADIYARMNGQEIAFASLAGDLKNINADQIIDEVFNSVDDLIKKAININIDSVRTAQVYLDYYLPTTHGFPLKVELEGTAVAGLTLGRNIDRRSEGGSDTIKLYPSLSTQINGFVGYDFYIAQVGIRTVNRITTSTGLSININHSSERGFELEVDLPEKMELLNVESETYLLRGILGIPDTKVNPSSVRSTRFQSKSCMNRMESALGIKICYDVDLPNIFMSQGLPLGPPSHFKFFLEKSEQNMKGYHMKATIQNTSGKKEIKIEIDTPGSSIPRRATAVIVYGSEGDINVFSWVLESQSQGGIKAELRNKWTQTEKMFELNTYCSGNKQYSPDTKGIEARFQMNDDGQEIKLDALLRTLYIFQEHLDIKFEVEGDLRYSEMKIPLPQRLRKFECTVATHKWNAVTFMQKAGNSQYNSVFKLGQKGAEEVDFKANHIIEGSSYHDLTLKTDIIGKIGSSQYRTQFVLYANDAKIGTTIEILRGDSAKIADLEIIFERSGENHKIKFLLGVPDYVNTILCQASATNQGASNYQVEISGKHGGKAFIHVQGPVTVHLSSKLTHFQAQLGFVFFGSQPQSFKTAIIFGPKKQLLSFELSNQSQRHIHMEWSMSTQDSQETTVGFKADLPSLIKKSVIILMSRTTFHLSVDDVLAPTSTNQLMLKGFLDIDFENKKAACKFTWDSEETKDNTFKAAVGLASASSTLQDSVFQGTWSYQDKSGNFMIELKLADAHSWFNGINSMKIDITTSSQKAYQLDTEIRSELWALSPKIAVRISLKTPESKQYKLSSENLVQWLDGPCNAKVISKSEFTYDGRQSGILIEAEHLRATSKHQAYLQIQITNPALQQPMYTKIALDNQQDKYSFRWKIENGMPVDAAMYELTLVPEGGVQLFRAELKLEAVKELLKSIDDLFSSGSPSPISGFREAQATYLFMYRRPMSASHSLLMHTPSRKMEGEVKYSPSEVRLRFQPKIGYSEPNYELYFNYSKSSWGGPTRLQGRMNVPGLPKEMQADVQYTRDELMMSGLIELDIFPNTDDKIVGKLESRAISPNTVIVEATLHGKALKVNPNVIVTAAYGPQTIGFDFKFQKTDSSPISLLISGKLDMSFGRNGASSFIVETDNIKVIDISGSVQPYQSPECYGIVVKSKMYSSVIGHYDVSTEWCKPFLVRFLSQKHESDNRYEATLGMENLRRVEISMAESNSKTGEKIILGMVHVKLLTPKVVMVETKYEKDQLLSIKSSLHQKWSSLLSSAVSWLDKSSHEVLIEGSPRSPSSQVARVWQEIKNEASRIYEDLDYDGVVPFFHKKLRIVSDIIHGFTIRYWKIWSKYEQARQQLSSSTSEAIIVVGGAHALQTGTVPKDIHRILSQIKEFTLFREAKRILDSLFREYPEEYQSFKQVLQKLQRTLVKDLEKERRNFMSFKKPQQVVTWIVSHLNFEHMVFTSVDHLIKTIIGSTLLIPIQMDGNHIKALLPVREPVYSLPLALPHISVGSVPTVDSAIWTLESLMPTPTDNLIWAYYSLLPRQARYLLPPYNSTAVVVDGTEIFTFDGAVLRVPHSPCKVLLAQYKSETLVMQNQQPSTIPQFTMRSSETTVEVKPDFTVTMNGQLISGPRHVQGKVEIYKEAEKIEVRTPYITLHVNQKSLTAAVEVSGWTFGQLAGLLGTYDGEMGTDKITPCGSKSSNMQELVKSWQEDQNCQTPEIPSKGILKIPVMNVTNCDTIFSSMVRCNPIVPDRLFLEVCYTSNQVCSAARAYAAVCSLAGVHGIYPAGC